MRERHPMLDPSERARLLHNPVWAQILRRIPGVRRLMPRRYRMAATRSAFSGE